MLEVVRIRQQGFPVRMPYEQFFQRFNPLYMHAARHGVVDHTRADLVEGKRQRAQLILRQADLSVEGAGADAALGSSLVLLRNGKLGLVDDLQGRIVAAAICLQSHFRAIHPRRFFTALRRATRGLQSMQRRRKWRRIVAAVHGLFRLRVRSLLIVARACGVYEVMNHPKVCQRS